MIERRPFDSLRRRQPWLARCQAPFLLRRLLRARPYGLGRAAGSGTMTPSPPTAASPPHGHADMEIITYVREGAITHQDNQGNQGRTAAGDVQVMSAGTGIRHSEYNLESSTTRIFQIWILPNQRGAAPGWGAKPFPKGDRSGRFVTLASGYRGRCRGLADPHRRPRAGCDTESRRDGGICAGRSAPRLPRPVEGCCRGEWRQDRHAGWRRHPA